MKEKLEEIWRNHKRKIVIAGILVGGMLIFVSAHKIVKIPAVEPTTLDKFSWTFENFDEAIKKFKGVEDACINLGKGEVALFGGGDLSNPNKYTVMYL